MDFEANAAQAPQPAQVQAPEQKQGSTSLDYELMNEMRKMIYQGEWDKFQMMAQKMIMKRFHDRIDPAWYTYMEDLLKDSEMPRVLPAEWGPDFVLEACLERKVLYTDARAQVKTYTIRTLLETIYADQRDDPALALKIAPSRIDNLQTLKDPGSIKMIVSDPNLHKQFMLQYFTRLPAFIKSKESNPKQSGTGSWMWPFPGQGQSFTQIEGQWGK